MLYPVAIEPGDEHRAFGVAVPDVPGCFSAGDTLDEAMANAKDAIELHFEALADAGELPPLPSTLTEHSDNPDYAGWVWALVDVDTEPYMGKASKINVTLPDLLAHKIDTVVGSSRAYKSRSHFLQVAALHELEKMVALVGVGTKS
ncbi:type II toxin-antitoxin system HicB family antitoxin [Rheinheimera sp.]|uniref:type II toxin-antitoxin system HicB family antitoxin n=1 Tax=Rheinheimera sp. TaxID=1869214 RepID=UPI00307D3C69